MSHVSIYCPAPLCSGTLDCRTVKMSLMREEQREEFQQQRETEFIYSAQVEDVPLTVSTSCVHYKQQQWLAKPVSDSIWLIKSPPNPMSYKSSSSVLIQYASFVGIYSLWGRVVPVAQRHNCLSGLAFLNTTLAIINIVVVVIVIITYIVALNFSHSFASVMNSWSDLHLYCCSWQIYTYKID